MIGPRAIKPIRTGNWVILSIVSLRNAAISDFDRILAAIPGAFRRHKLDVAPADMDHHLKNSIRNQLGNPASRWRNWTQRERTLWRRREIIAVSGRIERRFSVFFSHRIWDAAFSIFQLAFFCPFLFRLYFDSRHMIFDEIAVSSGGGIFDAFADSINNECFDLGRRNSANRSGTFGLSLD